MLYYLKSPSAGKNKNAPARKVAVRLLLIFAMAQMFASCSLNRSLDFADKKYFNYPTAKIPYEKKEAFDTEKANIEQNQNQDYRAGLENELPKTCVTGKTLPPEKENTVSDKTSNLPTEQAGETSKNNPIAIGFNNTPFIKKHLQSIIRNKQLVSLSLKNNSTAYLEINDNKKRGKKNLHLKSPLPSDRLILEVILSFILPPLAVYLNEGRITDFFWIDLLLTFLFWFPGVIFALLIVFDYLK